jgi:hypothetical protein
MQKLVPTATISQRAAGTPSETCPSARHPRADVGRKDTRHPPEILRDIRGISGDVGDAAVDERHHPADVADVGG